MTNTITKSNQFTLHDACCPATAPSTLKILLYSPPWEISLNPDPLFHRVNVVFPAPFLRPCRVYTTLHRRCSHELSCDAVAAVLDPASRFLRRGRYIGDPGTFHSSLPFLLIDPRLTQQLHSSSVLLPSPVTPQCPNGVQKTLPSIYSSFSAAVAILPRCSPCFDVWILIQSNTPIEPTS